MQGSVKPENKVPTKKESGTIRDAVSLFLSYLAEAI
jgi:hypothetical protein